MKRIYLLLIVFLLFQLISKAQSGLGEIRGRVLDEKTKKPLDYVSITLKLNGVTKGAKLTDDDGNFIFKPLQPGSYDLYATYVGYGNKIIQDIEVASEEIRFVNFGMSQGVELNVVTINQYKKPLIDPGGVRGNVLGTKELLSLPTRNTNRIAGQTLGVESRDGGTPNFRGARSDATAYYIDGIRVNSGESAIPQNAIDQVQIITAGTPAQYGDFVGGAISSQTKAPTRNFFRTFEYITATPFNPYLDRSQLNTLQGVISGPMKIIDKGRGEKERVILGFLLSGSMTYAKDPNPPLVDIYTTKPDKLKQIQDNPLVPGPSGTLVPAAEYLTKSDITKVDYRPNVPYFNASLIGNFNYQPTNNINVRLGYFGYYTNQRNWSAYNSLVNYDNNSLFHGYTLRTYAQVTQNFNKKEEDEKDKAKKEEPLIKNAFYTIRVSYENNYRDQMNAEHQTNLFDYGYLGTFKTYSAPVFTHVGKSFGQSPDSFQMSNGKYIHLTNYYGQTGFRDTLTTFEQANINVVTGNYTKDFYNYYGRANSESDINNLGGLVNGYTPNGIYSLMWANAGATYSGYAKSQNETYALYVMSEATVAPKRNPKAGHDLQFGFTYEQQFGRNYSVGAVSLWRLMNQLVNNQFTGLDSSNPILKFNSNGVFQDTVFFDRRIDASQQSNFDNNLRKKLIASGATDVYGNPVTNKTYLDINSFKPSTYSLDMFNANELLNNGGSVVGYNGYDYLGNRVNVKPGVAGIDQFLNNSNRLIPAYQPIYTAAWFQDKFVFKDLVLRIGVRVERFDANSAVLKDPYSIVPIQTAGEVRKNANESSLVIPSVIGDGYAVYVNNQNQSNPNSLSITGFRSGNNWYDKFGNPVTDPNVIARAGNTSKNIPLFAIPTSSGTASTQLPTKESFLDYQPDVHVLPRIWFSFPISTVSKFFASYDVLAQRPGNNQAQIDDYYFIQNRISQAGHIDNPNLKMQTVTDYEIGFDQLIGQDASLGIRASYREYRDMTQLYRYTQAWPTDYITYGNLDFGTVKSISLEYKIQELGNISLNASYQLQFANGTGSNATSSTALVSAGLPTLRTIFPLDIDTRHTLKTLFDYHYRKGKDYDGPVVNGKKIFESAGITLIFNTYSGRPYTQRIQPTPGDVQSGLGGVRSQILGTINGSNLPAQYNFDINIDKIYTFKRKKIDGNTVNYNLRTFLSIQNLFNVANVISVYPYSGSAYNDGYLNSPQSQSQIRAATSAQSFVDLYNTRMVNPDKFSYPRTVRLGISIGF